jgi:hypothetical protein
MLSELIRQSKFFLFFVGIAGAVFFCGCEEGAMRDYYGASYDKDYAQRESGQVVIEVGDAYELANIIIALSDAASDNEKLVRTDTGYYHKVMSRFGKYKGHKLFDELSLTRVRDFYGFRENSFGYEMRGGGIVSKGRYENLWHPNRFREHIELIRDFAEVSDFAEFYNNNMSFYNQLASFYGSEVEAGRMWWWLEEQFPGRHDSVRVVFSPLSGRAHSTRSFSSGGFDEIIMFVSAPRYLTVNTDQRLQLEKELFTEFDHNYVDRVTASYRYEIEAAISDGRRWYRGGLYSGRQAMFNEYMTWGVYLLYAWDTYEMGQFEEVRREVVRQMVNDRGFLKFDEFADELLKLYSEAGNEVKVYELYPQIIKWVERLQARQR